MKPNALATLVAASSALGVEHVSSPRDRLPAQRAPRDGEMVVSCGHGPPSPLLDKADSPSNPGGWFEFINPETGRTGVTITGPRGAFEVRWLSCCAACLKRAKGDPRRVTIRTHFPFAGVPC